MWLSFPQTKSSSSSSLRSIALTAEKARHLDQDAAVSAGVVVVLVVGLFFIIGITVGVIVVIALSAVRRDRRTDLMGPGEPAGQPPTPRFGTHRAGPRCTGSTPDRRIG
jgi:MFS superfamily sulfate permease-like transporter